MNRTLHRVMLYYSYGPFTFQTIQELIQDLYRLPALRIFSSMHCTSVTDDEINSIAFEGTLFP